MYNKLIGDNFKNHSILNIPVTRVRTKNIHSYIIYSIGYPIPSVYVVLFRPYLFYFYNFRMVCGYLVHHGYVGAAEAFAKSTGQNIEEDWTKIRNRQAIQKLVLEGKMGAAINLTDQLYPGFLQKHSALHFMLKVRQFIEMVGGHDEAILDDHVVADNHATEDNDHDQDMANFNKDDDVVMNGKETNGNVTSTSSEIAESSTAEEDGAANEDDDPQDLMEVDDHQQPNVTANPGMN